MGLVQSPAEAGSRCPEAELPPQALHSSWTLNPRATDITLDGDSSQVYSRGASHSPPWGFARPPELTAGPACGFTPSQALNRSGVQAQGHSQPGVEAAPLTQQVGEGAMPLRASLSPGPLLLPGTQTPSGLCTHLAYSQGHLCHHSRKEQRSFLLSRVRHSARPPHLLQTGMPRSLLWG